MRVKVSGCVSSVMDENLLRKPKFSELTMCPLTSSISTNPHAEMGIFYPHRILLSFLRRRLLGKCESSKNNSESGESSHKSSKIVSKSKSSNMCCSQIGSSSGLQEEVVSSRSTFCSRRRYLVTQQCKQCCKKLESGGISNHRVSCQILKSKSCTCCSFRVSYLAQNDNHTSSTNQNSIYSLSSQIDERSEFPTTHNQCMSNRFCKNSNDETGSLSCLISDGAKKNAKSTAKFAWLKFFFVLFILSLLTGSSEACGPGRGAGRRRAPRKLTPLVYKQHVPNVPENTLSASGFTEGRITRKDNKFKNLVPNYNQDIIFRDEEGTGADRLMTQRCKEKLNTLAISVMNQWPGVKLRVIEGWDEELHHATHSLHYEGRAVDITTSDKDRSKYGMLARLAVEAGFDWVYYESRAHIHCSVKSDSSQTSRTGGCFSGNSTVETPSGPRKMQEIVPGDKILTIDSDGNEVFSDVLMFLDLNTTEVREFFQLTTESGKTLTLTPSHLLFTIQPEGITPDDEWLLTKNRYLKPDEVSQYFLSQAEITFAKYVQIGDWVLVKTTNESGNGEPSNSQAAYTVEKIVGIEAKVEMGVYAPLTSTGNLIVDGVLTSCYALIEDQSLAHLAFAPVRLAHNFRQSLSYLWKEFSRFISFSHVLPYHGSDSASQISQNDIPTSLETNKLAETMNQLNNPSVATARSAMPVSEQGIHWYASILYSATRFILPSSLLYD